MAGWSRFLAAVDEAVTQLGFESHEEPWFRGQEDASWSLVPSLLRSKRTDIEDLEPDLFYEFSSKAWSLHASRLDSWETLFVMRHHGVATRLLDWTEQFGVALYFAMRQIVRTAKHRGTATPDPALWILNPFRLNARSASWGHPYLVSPQSLFDKPRLFSRGAQVKDYLDLISMRARWPYRLPVAIYPRQISSRQQAQGGWFTLHGRNPKGLDAMVPNAVRKLTLPIEAVAGGLDFLRRTGMNEYSLFPDLDGLARSLHDKYGLR